MPKSLSAQPKALRPVEDTWAVNMRYSEQIVLVIEAVRYGRALDLSKTGTRLRSSVRTYDSIPVEQDGTPKTKNLAALQSAAADDWQIEAEDGTGGRLQLLLPAQWSGANPKPGLRRLPLALAVMNLELPTKESKEMPLFVTMSHGGDVGTDGVVLPVPSLHVNLVWDWDTNKLSVAESSMDDVHLSNVTAEDADKSLEFTLSSGRTIKVSLEHFFAGTATEFPDKVGTADVDELAVTMETLEAIQAAAAATLDDEKYMTLKRTVRALQRVIKIASTTQLGAVLIARDQDLVDDDSPATVDHSRVLDVEKALALIEAKIADIEAGDVLPAHLQQETLALFSRAGALFWGAVRQLPSTPTLESEVGHLLQVARVGGSNLVRFGPPPEATEDKLGAVRGASQSQAGAGSGTKLLAWSNNLLRRLINVALPTMTRDEAVAGTSVARRAATALAIKQAVQQFAGEGEASIADDSIGFAKALATTVAQQMGWRNKIKAAFIGAGTAPPAIANVNLGDIWLFTNDVASGVSFVDISDTSTEVTAAKSTDILMAIMLRSKTWVRVGNIFEGHTARLTAEKALAGVNRLSVFETATLNPGGIPGNTFPEFVALNLEGKIDPRTIAEIKVNFGGPVVSTLNQAADLAPFNGVASMARQSVGPGGIINISLPSADRDNLQNAVQNDAQFIRVEIQYKFEGTSLSTSVLPDTTDYIHFGTNNNGFRSPGGGLNQAQVDARIDEKIRPITERAGTATVASTWTYPLNADDTKITIATIPRGASGNLVVKTIPRALLSSAATQLALDLRVADESSPSGTSQKSVGVTASISGNTLTLSVAQWFNNNKPRVFSE